MVPTRSGSGLPRGSSPTASPHPSIRVVGPPAIAPTAFTLCPHRPRSSPLAACSRSHRLRSPPPPPSLRADPLAVGVGMEGAAFACPAKELGARLHLALWRRPSGRGSPPRSLAAPEWERQRAAHCVQARENTHSAAQGSASTAAKSVPHAPHLCRPPRLPSSSVGASSPPLRRGSADLLFHAQRRLCPRQDPSTNTTSSPTRGCPHGRGLRRPAAVMGWIRPRGSTVELHQDVSGRRGGWSSLGGYGGTRRGGSGSGRDTARRAEEEAGERKGEREEAAGRASGARGELEG
ncbi:hypothetical protein BS78_05G197000 [Paspalum vaginatum]|nr:hypothetical protein BS78_05G197000 [Paspalum vaginatum]